MRKITIKPLIYCLLVSIIMSVLTLPGFSLATKTEYIFLDYHLNKTVLPLKENNIIVILAGDDTLEELGEWPISREVYASLINGSLSNAKTIILDIIFSEYSETTADQNLKNAIQNHGSVVLAGVIATDEHRLLEPAPELSDVASAVGYANSFPEADMVSRKYTLFLKQKLNETIYQLPGLVCAGLSINGNLTDLDDNKAELVDFSNNPVELTLDDNNAFWKTRVPSGAYESYELVDVINGKVSAEVFEGAMVFVGASATGAADIVRTSDGYINGVQFLADSAYIALAGFNPLKK